MWIDRMDQDNLKTLRRQQSTDEISPRSEPSHPDVPKTDVQKDVSFLRSDTSRAPSSSSVGVRSSANERERRVDDVDEVDDGVDDDEAVPHVGGFVGGDDAIIVVEMSRAAGGAARRLSRGTAVRSARPPVLSIHIASTNRLGIAPSCRTDKSGESGCCLSSFSSWWWSTTQPMQFITKLAQGKRC